MRESVAIFPDTNIFLHYRSVSEIDWCDLADARSVELVVCLTVIHELDDKKRDPRLSARAERAIKDIRDAHRLRQPIREGVTLSVFNREIRAADFPDTLSPEIGDDRIVHLARLFAQEGKPHHVAVATGDYGMELRCEAGGIHVIVVPDSLRLPHPLDETTKKLRQAQDELAALKGRLPKLSLHLHRAGDMSADAEGLRFEMGGAWSPLNIEVEMEKVRQMSPKSAELRRRDEAIPSAADFLRGSVSPERWKRYDERVDEFYEEYRQYLEAVNVIESAKVRSISFDLHVRNDGSGPATDIDVDVLFPPNLVWIGLEESKEAAALREPVEPPKPPDLPSLLERLAGLPRSLPRSYEPEIAARFPSAWEADTGITKIDDGSHEMRCHVQKLKHGHDSKLGPFRGVFSVWEDPKPFEVRYTISASEIPKPEDGKLAFIVRLESPGEQ